MELFSTTNGLSAKWFGIIGTSAAKTFTIETKTALNRIRLCNQCKTWSVADWKRIVITDELNFQLCFDGITTEWTQIWSRLVPKSTNKRSIMFWGVVHIDYPDVTSFSCVAFSQVTSDTSVLSIVVYLLSDKCGVSSFLLPNALKNTYLCSELVSSTSPVKYQWTPTWERRLHATHLKTLLLKPVILIHNFSIFLL